MQVEEKNMFSALFSVVTNILFLYVRTEPQHSAVPLRFLPSIFNMEFTVLISYTLYKRNYHLYKKKKKSEEVN